MPAISADTLAIIIGMLVNFAGMSLWLGRIYGQVTAKLTEHQERHIRHEARLDEHQRLIRTHGESIAYLKARANND